MLGPLITLIALGLSLAWTLFLRAGVYPTDWASTVFFVGCTCLFYWFLVRKRSLAPQIPAWLKAVIFALPVYCAFQLLPLPLGLLKLFSPARVQLVAALAPVMPAVKHAAIAVNPPAALHWSVALLTYIATFFLVRELGWRFVERPWITVAPLFALGCVEAIFGMMQVSAGWPNAQGTGTYTNRDHFSGMLEMLLPLAVMFGWAILHKKREDFDQSAKAAMQVGGAWAMAALFLVAIVYSMSRMGFFVAVCSLFVTAALSFGPRLPSKNFRTIGLTVVAVGSLALFVFLPPDQLIGRFADMAATGKISGDTRVFLWKETLSLIDEFRWFGCGLGGFQPAFLKYQGTINGLKVEFAHNDYLQYFAELGFFGFAILIAAVAGVLIPVVRGIVRVEDENQRLLLVGCAGGFIAIALHSLVDFNLYIPANAMILSWIAGVASINGLE